MKKRINYILKYMTFIILFILALTAIFVVENINDGCAIALMLIGAAVLVLNVEVK